MLRTSCAGERRQLLPLALTTVLLALGVFTTACGDDAGGGAAESPKQPRAARDAERVRTCLERHGVRVARKTSDISFYLEDRDDDNLANSAVGEGESIEINVFERFDDDVRDDPPRYVVFITRPTGRKASAEQIIQDRRTDAFVAYAVGADSRYEHAVPDCVLSD